MKILREVNGYQLNQGNQMADGLCNVSKDEELSFWFDSETRDELMESDDEDFVDRCENLIAESLVD